MTVTWNPADKGTDISLSNGDKTATKTATGWVNCSVRATDSQGAGKCYFEIQVDVAANEQVIGIATSAAPVSSYLGSDANGWGWNSAGYLFHSGNQGAYGGAWLTGNIGVAYDGVLKKLWFRKEGVWIGDPVAGTGEAFSGISGNVFPMASIFVLNDVQSCLFSSDLLVYDIPSGYEAWDWEPPDLTAVVTLIAPSPVAAFYCGATMSLTAPAPTTTFHCGGNVALTAPLPIIEITDPAIPYVDDAVQGQRADHVILQDSTVPEGDIELIAPMPSATTHCGATVGLTAPAPTTAIAATYSDIGRIILTPPMPSVVAYGGGRVILSPPMPATEAEATVSKFAVLSMIAPMASVSIEATVGILADILLAAPMAVVGATGYAGAFAQIGLTAPIATIEIIGYDDLSGDISLVAPMGLLEIEGSMGNRFTDYVLRYDPDRTGCEG